MLEALTNGVATVIDMGGSVINAIVGADGDMNAVLPLIGVSIALGIVGWGITKLKSLVWGF